jgi:hypothetical protein
MITGTMGYPIFRQIHTVDGQRRSYKDWGIRWRIQSCTKEKQTLCHCHCVTVLYGNTITWRKLVPLRLRGEFKLRLKHHSYTSLYFSRLVEWSKVKASQHFRGWYVTTNGTASNMSPKTTDDGSAVPACGNLSELFH